MLRAEGPGWGPSRVEGLQESLGSCRIPEKSLFTHIYCLVGTRQLGTRVTDMMSFSMSQVGKSISVKNILQPGHRLS
ncbi:hypothetical protein EYF80_012699 [Liparis tanakae]|uniref:Uncharacterized protein n=1 Tax=Liparis tanakae TaxID=230148 RepID=A0A4Z2IH63_9TELE|nr:hypothetical protein EYF80_012699 [Liparis tanakae]